MSYQEKYNAIPVSLQEMHLAVNEVHKLPAESCDWEGRMATLAKLFASEPDKGLAIDCRLTALSKIVTAGVLPENVVTLYGDAADLADSVWEVAAIMPFKVDATTHDAEFDQQAFLEAVTSMSGAARH